MRIEEELLKACMNKGITVGLAESCTGGAISARITSVPGASKYFLGSIVSYHANLKQNLLNVSKSDLEKYSDVSPEVALDMWKGLIKVIQPMVGAAITGLAGPDGASADKPVGLVYIAVGLSLGSEVNDANKFINGNPQVLKFNFKGDRNQIIAQAVDQTLKLLLDLIR